MIVAVLSTSVMPKDGVYSIYTIPRKAVHIEGVPHYIGHPCTKRIIEEMGAVQANNRSFRGLRIGEEALCVPIKHERNKREHRYTRANQNVTVDDLCFRVLKRLA
jgi:hypothetical protein